VTLQAPKPAAARVACAGGNYADHAAAMLAKLQGEPLMTREEATEQVRKMGVWGFWKVAREATGPDGEVLYPVRTRRLDSEGEVAVSLGRQGKAIDAGPSRDFVWGVTFLAD